MRAEDFYEEACHREDWPEGDLCNPPTNPRIAIHVLIDHFLGEDWYVATPQNDDQCITVAVYEILKKYPNKKEYTFKERIKHFLGI